MCYVLLAFMLISTSVLVTGMLLPDVVWTVPHLFSALPNEPMNQLVIQQ